LINNFSAGEFGPLASARTDLDRYGASQELCQNFIPRVQGGAVKREATKYVSSTKSDGVARLEKFIFSNENAYVLEFGNNYIRFYTDGGQIVSGTPVEITTIFPSNIIYELSFTQSNDILYIFHKNYPPFRLIRNSDTDWDLEEIVFQDGPWGATNQSFFNARKDLRYLTPSSPSVGAYGIYLSKNTTSVSSFSNNGGYTQINTATNMLPFAGESIYIKYPLGLGNLMTLFKVKSVDSETAFTIDVLYASFNPASGTIYWTPQEAEGRYIRVLDSSGVWGIAEIIGDDDRIGAVGKEAYKINVLSTLTSNGQKKAWRFSLQKSTGGYYEDGYFSAGCFHEDRLFLAGPSQYISGSKNGDYENFAPSDLSGTIADNNGITVSLNSSDTNNLKWIVSDEKGLLAGTNANEWLIKSSSTQEPITPTSVTAKKTTSFGSQSIQPVQAGKATIFPQASLRKIREFNYFYDVDGFRCNDVTQLAHHICESGVKQLALSKQPEQIVWAVRNDGQLIGMTYERDLDGLRVAWHRHIIGGAFSDGDAVVESVACIPTSDNSYDEIWLVVKRTINGSTKRYIEYIGQPFTTEIDQEDSFFVDCGLKYDLPKTMTGATKANPIVVSSTAHGFANGDLVRFDEVKGMTNLNGNIYKVADQTANTFELTTIDGTDINSTSFNTYVSGGEIRKLVTTISGLSHLEGQTVQACGDGVDLGDYTVSGGSITLSEPSAVVSVGLGYQSKIKLQRIDAGSQDGTSLGKTRRIHRLGVMLHRTLGLKYGQNFDDMKQFEFSSGNDQMNEGTSLYTGIITQEADFEYDTENKICLMSDRPTPCTLLAVMPLMQTQDR
jgi:hypothetical protein